LTGSARGDSLAGVAAIFLSYRRKDAQDVVGRIYDRLRERFPSASIFRDLDSIPLGKPFPQVLREAASGAAVALVVIGPEWTTVRDEQGRRRLDDPGDFVRGEIETTLVAGIPVVPVLVSNAKMPRPEDLPESLRPLLERQGIEVHPDPYFHHDMDRLIGKLTALMPAGAREAIPPITGEPARSRGALFLRARRRPVLASLGLLAGLLLVAAAVAWLRWPASPLERGQKLLKEGRGDEARQCFEDAIRQSPATSLSDQAFYLRAEAAGKTSTIRQAYDLYYEGWKDQEQHRDRAARDAYEQAWQLDPFLFWSANNLASLLATSSPDTGLRDPARAVALAKKSCETSGWRCWQTLDTLAIASEANGGSADAIRYEQMAIELAPAGERPDLQNRLEQFGQGP
jgi:tetratricopeptide (TPR) repeat protein